jgi:hypothetical protein
MAGYQGLNSITDPSVREVVKGLFDEINALKRKVADLQSTAMVNSATIQANGQRLTGLALPAAETDAVSVAFLRQYVQAQVDTF